VKPTLFLLLGYPGSGKSTVSRQLAAARGMVRINSDELRDYMYGHSAEVHDPKYNPPVFGALDYVTDRLLAAGQSVLYDANNNRRRERIKHEKLAAQHSARMVVLWVNTSLDVAKQREAGRALDPNHLAIPPEIYERSARAFQEPTPEEAAIIIDGLSSADEQLRSFDTQLANLEEGPIDGIYSQITGNGSRS